MLKSIKEQYADYIIDAMQTGNGFLSFDQWLEQRNTEQATTHKIILFSEKLNCHMTFSIEQATTKAHAKELAKKALADFEFKHTVQVGPNGKVLTEEEMRLKMIETAQRFLVAEQRKLENIRKKAEKLALELSRQ